MSALGLMATSAPGAACEEEAAGGSCAAGTSALLGLALVSLKMSGDADLLLLGLALAEASLAEAAIAAALLGFANTPADTPGC